LLYLHHSFGITIIFRHNIYRPEDEEIIQDLKMIITKWILTTIIIQIIRVPQEGIIQEEVIRGVGEGEVGVELIEKSQNKLLFKGLGIISS
jgi:hypothetical protein